MGDGSKDPLTLALKCFPDETQGQPLALKCFPGRNTRPADSPADDRSSMTVRQGETKRLTATPPGKPRFLILRGETRVGRGWENLSSLS